MAAQPKGDSAIDRLITQMTLEEKIAMLHGATDPERFGQAGYLPGVPRLGIPPLRLSDGPAGVRTAQPATALPAPVALAATFSPDFAQEYGRAIARDGRARHQNVILAPMVNIVRVPQGGRNFETLGEDPWLTSQLAAAEVVGIQSEGLIATVKHFALNNQENQRQSVSADVDEQTLHEIELPGFRAATGMSSAVMAAYNKVNGTWSSEQPMLLTDILRREWNFKGFVMSDWGGTHSGVAAITAGLDLEMPSGRNFEALADAVKSGALPIAVVDQSARHILTAMQAVGLLNPITPRPVVDVPATSAIARDIATAGAVLLKNEGQLLPLLARDRVAVIGPTGRSLLVGGGGSAHVTPRHSGSVLDALRQRMTAGEVTYAVGYDIEGTVVPATALALRKASASGGEPAPESTIDFTGARALAAGSSWTWTGTITAPSTGDYVLKLQTAGGRATLTLDTPPPSVPAPGGGRGRGGRGGGGAAGLLATADGLSNPSTPVHFDAGAARPITIAATAADTDAMQLRLAWLTPSSATDAIAGAVGVAKAAHTAIVFAYDEGQEGRDRASLSLPGSQDALITAVAAANPRTAVVLNNGAPVLMPWVDRVSAILQMWYPGQEGADATMALLVGDASPSGRLPVTFPRRVEDVPTNSPERYPGVDGHGRYSEGIYVGYRWYDQQGIAPLFPFGHGLSYTNFEYSKLDVTPRGDGFDVVFTLKNAGTRTGIEVPQLYVGRPAAPPAPMAERRLVQFERVGLAAGSDRRVAFYINRDALSYWSAAEHRWVVATGARAIMIGASSRDIRLRTDVNVK